MKENLKLVAVVLVVALVSGYFGGLVGNQSFGASGTRFPNGVSADSTSPVAGEVRGTDLTITDDATISGGTVLLTTSNTATSSLTVGCIQMYATSTATALKLDFNTQATTTINGTANGVATWKYGTCP